MVTMESLYRKTTIALSNGMIDDSPRPSFSKIGVPKNNARLVICRILNGYIFAAGHLVPIHFMFGSRLWLSGAADRMTLFSV